MAQPTEAPGRRTAIVTGGASGIGLGVTEHLATQGYNVAVFDVNIDSGNEVVSKLRAENPQATLVFKKCDVSSWQNQAEAFKEVYTQFGKIDFVFANAGISERGKSVLANFTDDEPQEPNLKVVDVNLNGVIFSVQLAIHYMNKNPKTGSSRGLIICTASNAGLYPLSVTPIYSATKAGVIGLVRSTAGLLDSHNIQINALAPAVLETNIAPDKALFERMIVTPMSTLVNGVAKFIADSSLTGEVAEIHGQNVTLRPQHEYVDEDTRKNLEIFVSLGYA